MADRYTARAVHAVLEAALSEHDFGGWLAGVLATAAAELGAPSALTAARSGCWEAELVHQLVDGTVGDDEYLAEHRRRHDGRACTPRQRPYRARASPGETCECGRPAVIVYITEKFGEVPYCGIADGGRGEDTHDV